MKKQKMVFVNKRRHSLIETILSRIARPISLSQPSRIDAGQRIMIFKSEIDYISRCILDCKNIETGGQLFGYWSKDDKPVVMYAIGPGPRANHQSTFFNQDIDYLVTIGKFLKKNFGLMHIGEWHSHHQLGLAKPSRHDVNTMVTTIREKDLGQFILCIGNCDNRSSSLNGYICDSLMCTQQEWDIIDSHSPVRDVVDSRLSNVLMHPFTPIAVHADDSLNQENDKPQYAIGYWLNKKGAGLILNAIMDYLKKKHPGSDVKAQINGAGEVQLEIKKGLEIERILFEKGFPSESPLIKYYYNGRFINEVKPSHWQFLRGDITSSFIHYYENI